MNKETLARLLNLHLHSNGGEKEAAGKQLVKGLQANGLSFKDIDASLPVSTDLNDLKEYRHTASLIAKLGGVRESEVLPLLTDAEDITETELNTLLNHLDLNKLLKSRVEGYASMYQRETTVITQWLTDLPESLHSYQGSVNERIRQHLSTKQYETEHPERKIRGTDQWHTAINVGLLRSMGKEVIILNDHTVIVRLNNSELALFRTQQSQRTPKILSKLSEWLIKDIQQGRDLKEEQ